jgi:hypothetical protein
MRPGFRLFMAGVAGMIFAEWNDGLDALFEDLEQ